MLALPATALALPDGEGHAEVERVCTACHGVNLIERSSGHTHDDWQFLISTMIDLTGDPDLQEEIVGYLSEAFPPGDTRAATPVEGPLTLRFEQWQVPTPGQRSRDPVEAPDGSIWWVGQWGDILGRIDPATGAMTEFDLPAGAKPHSANIGPDGAARYTGNGNATIGRLDPETGDVRLVTSPREGSRPYGVTIAEEGTVWVACNGANCLLRVDPGSLEVTEIPLPEAGTTVRRLEIDAEGIIWWVNSSLGRIGRYDPSTGEIREWDSPSGADAHPYATAVFDGAVWYNESGVRPDMLVRFDPESEDFRSWPIPSGPIHAGILRHMRTTRDGAALLIHQSGTNHIARVTVERTGASQ